MSGVIQESSIHYHVELFEHNTIISIKNVSVTEVEGQPRAQRPLLGLFWVPGVTEPIVPGPQVVQLRLPVGGVLAQVVHIAGDKLLS